MTETLKIDLEKVQNQVKDRKEKLESKKERRNERQAKRIGNYALTMLKLGHLEMPGIALSPLRNPENWRHAPYDAANYYINKEVADKVKDHLESKGVIADVFQGRNSAVHDEHDGDNPWIKINEVDGQKVELNTDSKKS